MYKPKVEMKKILFLCTGNYYRSRFCEEYFNFHAEKIGIPWVADSMGIMRNFEDNGNVGPIAPHTLDELSRLGIDAKGRFRDPKYVYEEDLSKFDRVIAISIDEHKPMLEALWPDKMQHVEYFDVEDLHIEGFETALPKLKKHIDKLIKEIQSSSSQVTCNT
jgi:protein-tyrosine phosphatase